MLKQLIFAILDIRDEDVEVEPTIPFEDQMLLYQLGLKTRGSYEHRLYRSSQDPSGSLDDFDEDLEPITASPYY